MTPTLLRRIASGLLAVLFGILAFLIPGAAMLSLVFIFAAYAVADGIMAIAAAARAAKARDNWGWLALEGAAGIVAGVIAIAWPGLTVVLFVTLVAVWALMSGGFLLAAAFKLYADHGRWWMALAAVVSVAFGVALLAAPMMGALVLTWWVGAYALIFGVSMVVLAFKLRTRFHHLADALHA